MFLLSGGSNKSSSSSINLRRNSFCATVLGTALTDGGNSVVGAADVVGDATGGMVSSTGSWKPRPSLELLGSALIDGIREADGATECVGANSSTIPVLPSRNALGSALIDGMREADGATECVGAVTGGARSSASWKPLPIVLSLGSLLTEGMSEADGVCDWVGGK